MLAQFEAEDAVHGKSVGIVGEWGGRRSSLCHVESSSLTREYFKINLAKT